MFDSASKQFFQLNQQKRERVQFNQQVEQPLWTQNSPIAEELSTTQLTAADIITEQEEILA